MSDIRIEGSKARVNYGRQFTLVMLSGGPKSTALLYHYLKNTENIVLVHHLHYTTPAGAHVAESKRCKKIVAWLRKNVRDFAYSESVIDFKGIEYSGRKIHSLAMEVGLISGNFHLKYQRPLSSAILGHPLEIKDREERDNCQKVIDAFAFPFQSPALNFETVPGELPHQLQELTWNCEKPVFATEEMFIECGYCPACIGPTNAPDEFEVGATAEQKPAVLIMLSGGVDSVYQLYKYLKEDKRTVIAHHVNLANKEGRWQVEAEHTKKIVDWCRENIRDFIYSDSKLDHRGFNATGFDIMAVHFVAGAVANYYAQHYGYKIESVICGMCLEDKAMQGRVEKLVPMFEVAVSPLQPPSRKLDNVISKQEQIQQMPIDLTSLCWTCRFPVRQENGEFAECGECHTCELMNEIRPQITELS